MEGKKCAMCGQVKKLCESHIIPKFFGNYIKKNSPSGGLRNPNDVNKRKQDIYKENLLCKDCEEIFSKLETYFQKNIFSKVGVYLSDEEKLLRIDKNPENNKKLLIKYSEKEIDNITITRELFDFVVSIFYRYSICSSFDESEWSDEEKKLLNDFRKKGKEYFLGNKKIEFNGKFYLINSKKILESIKNHVNKDFAIEALYTGAYMRVQLLPKNIEDKNEEKYAKMTVIVPHFIMIYELYPNEKVDIPSSEELKIGNIIFEKGSRISEDLIDYIFKRVKEDLEKGTSNLSDNQILNILKQVENISDKDIGN